MSIANRLPKSDLPLPIRWGLEPLGERRKEFAREGRASGRSESLGRGEGVLLRVILLAFEAPPPVSSFISAATCSTLCLRRHIKPLEKPS
jgi:hypothetical protein